MNDGQQSVSLHDFHYDYLRAGLALAEHISCVDHIRTDPTYAADRTARADALREADLANLLRKFRVARAAFNSAIR